jgi:hypothetical protein
MHFEHKQNIMKPYVAPLLSLALASILASCGGGGGSGDGGASQNPPAPPPPVVNTPPTIRDDVITVSGTHPLIDVLANDTDPDGTTFTLTLQGSPEFGTAVVENGRIRLTLPAGFQGFTTFAYRAVDAGGAGANARALVFVDAEPVRFVYVTNEVARYASNVYIDDLLTSRRATSFEANGPTSLGEFLFTSRNGRTVLYCERGNPVNAIVYWTAAAADGSTVPRRINPTLTSGQTLELVSEPSPDGRYVAFRIQEANGDQRHYLVDVTGNAAPREIVLPDANARVRSSFVAFRFDGQTQFLFAIAEVQITPTERGETIYRIPVAEPAAGQVLFSAPMPDRRVKIVAASPNGDRALILVNSDTDAGLFLARGSQPANPLPLSQAYAGSGFFGDMLADWERNRVLFNIESLSGVTPYVSTLYVSDLTTGTWNALGQLPANFRPDLLEVHPSGGTVLFTTRMPDPTFGGVEQVREADLIAGTPTRLLFSDSVGLLTAQYTNDASSVVLGYGDPATFPRDDPSNVKTLFTEAVTSNFRFPVDGKILMVSAWPHGNIGSDEAIWAVNQVTGAGTFARRLARVTSHANPYVSPGAVIPRY